LLFHDLCVLEHGEIVTPILSKEQIINVIAKNILLRQCKSTSACSYIQSRSGLI